MVSLVAAADNECFMVSHPDQTSSILSLKKKKKIAFCFYTWVVLLLISKQNKTKQKLVPEN